MNYLKHFRGLMYNYIHNYSNASNIYKLNVTVPIIRRVSTSQVNDQQNLPSESDDSDAYKKDMPDPTLSNPYIKEKRQCILCKYKIEVNYKNVRLLSQFVSQFTGRMYDKHITGLCETQHNLVKSAISRAQKVGLMPKMFRDPKYTRDPKLYDPTRPQRPHPYG